MTPFLLQQLSGLVWVFAMALGGALLLVWTSRWHGRFSMDGTQGVQKFHTQPTPRVGGLPIVSALALWAWGWAEEGESLQLLQWLLLSGSVAFGFGLLEDLTKRVGVLVRLLATMASGVLAWWVSDVSLTRVDLPALDTLFGWVPFSVLFTAFAVGGVANALNIVDGFNGLASSTAVWAALGLAAIAVAVGDTALATVCVWLAAAALGFFCVNWPFGKLFLGDGGSYFLGFALAWCSVLLIERNPGVTAFAPLVVCALPIIEVLFSAFRRKVRQQSPGAPDRLHLHSIVKQRYVRRWLSGAPRWWRNSVTGVLVGAATLVCSLLAYLFHESALGAAVVFVTLAIVYVSVYARMVRQHWCSPFAFLLQVPKSGLRKTGQAVNPAP